MKKIIIVLILIFIISLNDKIVHADNYLTYPEMEFNNFGNKFIDDFSESDYKKYYSKLGKRRFWGWRTYTVYENCKVKYRKETLYILTNTGTTPIEQIYTVKTEDTVKKQYSVSGSIGLTVKGDISKLKLGLEDNIKGSIKADTKKLKQEQFEVRLEVDPNTRVIVMIEGEGLITNGVAKYYRFFKNVKKGGFEIFVVSTEYFSLVKEKYYEEDNR